MSWTCKIHVVDLNELVLNDLQNRSPRWRGNRPWIRWPVWCRPVRIDRTRPHHSDHWVFVRSQTGTDLWKTRTCKPDKNHEIKIQLSNITSTMYCLQIYHPHSKGTKQHTATPLTKLFFSWFYSFLLFDPPPLAGHPT